MKSYNSDSLISSPLQVRNWIFAVSAGMFVYIALVDLVSECVCVWMDHESLFKFRKIKIQFLYQISVAPMYKMRP